jgi:hypothetical protein
VQVVIEELAPLRRCHRVAAMREFQPKDGRSPTSGFKSFLRSRGTEDPAPHEVDLQDTTVALQPPGDEELDPAGTLPPRTGSSVTCGDAPRAGLTVQTMEEGTGGPPSAAQGRTHYDGINNVRSVGQVAGHRWKRDGEYRAWQEGPPRDGQDGGHHQREMGARIWSLCAAATDTGPLPRSDAATKEPGEQPRVGHKLQVAGSTVGAMRGAEAPGLTPVASPNPGSSKVDPENPWENMTAHSVPADDVLEASQAWEAPADAVPAPEHVPGASTDLSALQTTLHDPEPKGRPSRVTGQAAATDAGSPPRRDAATKETGKQPREEYKLQEAGLTEGAMRVSEAPGSVPATLPVPESPKLDPENPWENMTAHSAPGEDVPEACQVWEAPFGAVPAPEHAPGANTGLSALQTTPHDPKLEERQRQETGQLMPDWQLRPPPALHVRAARATRQGPAGARDDGHTSPSVQNLPKEPGKQNLSGFRVLARSEARGGGSSGTAPDDQPTQQPKAPMEGDIDCYHYVTRTCGVCQKAANDPCPRCTFLRAKPAMHHWQCCPIERRATLSQMVGNWTDQKSSTYKVEMDTSRQSCSVTTTRPSGDVIRSPGLLKQDSTRDRIIWGSAFYLIAEGTAPVEIRWVSLSGRSVDFRWSRTISLDQVQHPNPALARTNTGPGAGADAGAGVNTLSSSIHGTIRANSTAWDDGSAKLDRESEAWADCGESFQDSLSFKLGDTIIRMDPDIFGNDRWCWGELKGTNKQGWVPRALFSTRNRNTHQAAENRLPARGRQESPPLESPPPEAQADSAAPSGHCGHCSTATIFTCDLCGSPMCAWDLPDHACGSPGDQVRSGQQGDVNGG